MAKKRLISAATESTTRSSRPRPSAYGETVDSVPVGGFIHPHEAALPSVLSQDSRPRSALRGTAGVGYQAPTISHANKLKASVVESLPAPQQARADLSSSPHRSPDSHQPVSLNETQFHSLRQEEVSEAVDIPLSELNDILQAVGGMSSNPSRSGSSFSNNSSLGLVGPSPTPGAAPVGSSYVPRRNPDSSSDSSTLSVERRLQQLVESALMPEPPAPANNGGAFAGFDDYSSSSSGVGGQQGTRMSAKRKAYSNL